MSHGDGVEAPEGFQSSPPTPAPRSPHSRTTSAGCTACSGTRRSALDYGQHVLENFLHRAAGIAAGLEQRQRDRRAGGRIRAQVGAGRVICGLSGGVDSAVAAALVQRAVGDQLTCVFVDHGLLRAGEAEQVERDFVAATGVRLRSSTRRTSSSTRWPA